METLRTKGPSSIRELQDARRTEKISNAHVFEAVVPRNSAQRRMIDGMAALFGGKSLPIVAHLIDSGKLAAEEAREARKALWNARKETNK